jgi:hypothetical protein
MEKEFVLNIAQIKDSDLPGVVKELAWRIEAEGYINIGNWFKNLHDYDLTTLLEMAEAIRAQGDVDPSKPESEPLRSQYIMLLLAFMLRIGEGAGESTVSAEQEKENQTDMAMVTMYVTIESLARKGLVDIDYTAMSFDRASLNKVVAKPTAKGALVVKQLKEGGLDV